MIPFVDLKAQYRGIQSEVATAVNRVLESADFVQSGEVRQFEEEFAAYCGTEHAIAVNSGTSALHLALLALGIGPGDEVVTVPFTFVATIAAVGYTGAKPVFVDVEPDSLTMDVSRLEEAITSRTRAIMPVHLYGQVADMEGILDVGRRYGLPVVEDACQAHGAEYHRLRAGSIGEIGCFSFYPAKNLGAYGEGGAITTNDAALARQMRMLRNWGAEQKYIHTVKGYNYRLPEIQAAVLRVKLGHLEQWTEARRAHARLYDELLDGLAVTPRELPARRHAYHVYAVQVQDRSALQRKLDAVGIQTGVHYPVPLHLQPAWAELGHGPGDFPVSEAAADHVVSLPMYAELSDEHIAEVAMQIGEATRRQIA